MTSSSVCSLVALSLPLMKTSFPPRSMARLLRHLGYTLPQSDQLRSVAHAVTWNDKSRTAILDKCGKCSQPMVCHHPRRMPVSAIWTLPFARGVRLVNVGSASHIASGSGASCILVSSSLIASALPSPANTVMHFLAAVASSVLSLLKAGTTHHQP